MKIAVVYKWARDPETATVRNDGAVDWRGAKMTAGEDDPAALAGAKAIAEANGADLVGVTIGDGDASWALARGLSEAYSVTDVPALTDQSKTGQILAATVGSIGEIDVVAIGDAEQYAGVPMALAAELGWPVLLGLSTATAEGDSISVTRRTSTGHEKLTVTGPVVLGFSAETEEKKAPGMKEMLMARKRPINTLTLADLGCDAEERVVSQGTRAPDVTAAKVFEGNPEQTVGQLIEALRADGVLA